MFMDNDYVGFEFSPYVGFEFVPGTKVGLFSTNLGTEGPQLPIDLEESDEQMIIAKFGMLSPVANNIYMDTAILYAWFPEYVVHDGVVQLAVGISYFWN